MNRVVFLLIPFFNCLSTFGQLNSQYNVLIENASDAYNAFDYGLSVEYYERAFKIDSTNSIDLYNGACSATLVDDTLKAFYFLGLAIDNGYRNSDHIQKDCDLHSLRKLSSWDTIVAKVKLNDEKYMTIDKVVKSFIKSIKTNNAVEIWNLGNKYFKERVSLDGLKVQVDSIYNFIIEYNIDFNKPITNKSSLNLKNGIKTSTRSMTYILTPNIFGASTKDYFKKSFGCEISIELDSQQDKWGLNNISVNYNYFNNSINGQKLIESYFNDTVSFTLNMGVFSEKKVIECLSVYQADELGFFRSLKDLNIKDLKIIPVKNNTVAYKLYCSKKSYESPSKNNNLFGALFKKSFSKEILEIIYIENSKYLVLSNGEKYGVFQGDMNKLKEWILAEFRNIE